MDGNNPQRDGQLPRTPSRMTPGTRSHRKQIGNVTSCSTRMKQRSFSNYWSIENFSVQLELHNHGEFMLAPKFGDHDYEFVMKLFPNGKDEDTAGYLSLFLLINKCPNPRLRFRVSFTVETSDGPRSCHLNKNLVTINRSGIVTASKFFSLDIMKSAQEVYTPNDVLTIGCELTIFGEAVAWYTNLLYHPYSKNRTSPLAQMIPLGSTPSTSTSSPKEEIVVLGEEEKREDGFAELLATGDFSDFTVVSSCGREFRTHMCVLSARSDYFKALLRNQATKEYCDRRVKFQNISGDVLEIILQHIYTTSHDLTEHQLTPDLITAVDQLMIGTLRDEIAEVLLMNVTTDNTVDRMSMAAELRLDESYQRLLEFFSVHKLECMRAQSWIDMRRDKPQLAIQILEDSVLTSEEVVNPLDRGFITIN